MNPLRALSQIPPILAFLAFPCAASDDDFVQAVQVQGTSLTILTTDRRALTGQDLIGFTLTVTDDLGKAVELHIDGALRGGHGTGLEWLYDLRTQDLAGNWVPFCDAAADGGRFGFPVAGWTDLSGMFHPSNKAMTFSCTGGAIAKCVRMGYAPWNDGIVDATRLDHFRACTRMVRADYCGTGDTHTKDGTPVNVYDRRTLHRAGTAPGMSFEAAWGPEGAVCVARTRWTDLAKLDRLRAMCGDQFVPLIGAQCDPDTAHALPAALIFNEFLISCGNRPWHDA